jgi:hypothetical protein
MLQMAHRRGLPLLASCLGLLVGACGGVSGNGAAPQSSCIAQEVESPTIYVTLPADGPYQLPACVSAPANQPLHLVFANLAVPSGNAEGATGSKANLSIYPSKDGAYVDLAGGAGAEVNPSTRATALFVGTAIQAPATITYEVKALAAGSYWLQSDYDPIALHATLTVA